MGDVGSVDVPDTMLPQFDDLTIGERDRRAVGQVVQRNHAPESAVGDLSVRRSCQKLVHGTALV